jgi:hypothetical protein
MSPSAPRAVPPPAPPAAVLAVGGGNEAGRGDGAPRTPARTPTTAARRIDRVTTALLAASVGLTVGVATPSFLVAAGVDLPSVRGELPAGEPLVLPHRAPEIVGHSEGTELPFDPDGDDDTPEPHGQVGLTRGPLVLHDQPAGRASVVGDVQAGEMVTILRVAGDWALVYYNGGGLVVGWAKKSEIAIR